MEVVAAASHKRDKEQTWFYENKDVQVGINGYKSKSLIKSVTKIITHWPDSLWV